MILKKWLRGETRPTMVCAAVSAAALVLSLGGWTRGVLPFDPAWAAILLCGVPIVFGAAAALLTERNIKADLLVSMALIASVLIGEYFAAGEVALIMQIGTLLEDFTSGQARRGIEKLVRLTPQTARVRRDGRDSVIPAAQVLAGDLITVLAGETVPADGVILSGETSVDQSAMTGESIPADKKAGDRVISGTVNQYGTFQMKAEQTCADSSLQRMIRLAGEADAGKAPAVRLADRWASWMVLAAVTIAAVTGLVTGQAIRAVTVLVVFCPCAFVLATPTAVMAGIACAARRGILIRSGDALERLSKVSRIAFDKTGTLTRGRPAVTEVLPLNAGISADGVLRLAALAEQRSEHPLGRAILEAWLAAGGQPEEISGFRMAAGAGVRAEIGGREVLVGKPDLLRGAGIGIPEEAEQAIAGALGRGATVVLVAAGGAVQGLIALADALREDAAGTVARLQRAGVTPMLLTGDNEAAARAIAAGAGIEEVHAGLLPEDKMRFIRDCAGRGEAVCMVGDGVNDALALKTAFAGIAMGGIGSDIAVEAADAVLVGDEIGRLPGLFSLTKKVMRRIRQNILVSLGINLVAVVLSAAGLLNPVTGALMHNCGSVFVVVCAALLLREKDTD